jgi:hypothetical protein
LENPDHSKKRVQNFAAEEELGFGFSQAQHETREEFSAEEKLKNNDHSMKRGKSFPQKNNCRIMSTAKRGKNFPQKRNCRIMSTARNECKVFPLQKNQGLENHEHSMKIAAKEKLGFGES